MEISGCSIQIDFVTLLTFNGLSSVNQLEQHEKLLGFSTAEDQREVNRIN